jgi:hypothetical protein
VIAATWGIALFLAVIAVLLAAVEVHDRIRGRKARDRADEAERATRARLTNALKDTPRRWK